MRPHAVAPLDRWALSRALTRLANADPMVLADAQVGVATEVPATFARRIGLTGAPGAGKSSLIGHLVRQRLASGQRLGVLAVDPSSPRTGGAILGDRVRMDDLVDDERLYIRSLGSRRTGDGLADNLPEMLDLMDTFDFDEVLLETVGVGQAEHAVRAQVDTVVLVLLPDSGDAVQAMKAGIMEMADIFVVHKCDLPGAQRAATDLRRVAALQPPAAQDWVSPILLTSCEQPDSLAALSSAIDQHQAWRARYASDTFLARARYRLRRLIERRIARFVAEQDAPFFQQSLLAQADAAMRAAAAREEA